MRHIRFLSVMDRMMVSDLLKTIFSVLVVLVVIIVSRNFIKILKMAVDGLISTEAIFSILGLKIIIASSAFMVPAVFVSVLMVLGRMYRDQEMSAFCSAGVGAGRLYSAVFKAIVPVTLLSVWMSLYIAPWAANKVEEVIFEQKKSIGVRAIGEGKFSEYNNGNLVFYAEKISDDNMMHDVFVQNIRGKEIGILTAAQAQVREIKGGLYIVFLNGERALGNAGDVDFVFEGFSQYGMRLEEPDEMKVDSIEGIATQKLLEAQDLNELRELQHRLSVPMSILVLTIMAVPLAQVSPRSGVYGNLVAAFLIYFSFANFEKVSGSWMVKGEIPVWLGFWSVYFFCNCFNRVFTGAFVWTGMGHHEIKRAGTMNALDRYIIKEVLKGTLIALLILYALFNLFTLKDELRYVGQGDYDLQKILLYIGLLTPRYFYELMPSAALLGSLFVLGGMANHRELMAMRVSGISVLGIVRAVMVAGVVLVVFSFIIGEFVGPDAEKKAKVLRSVAKTQQPVARTSGGMWLRDGNQFIYIKDIFTQGDIANISIYELNDQHRLQKMTYAKRGHYLDKVKWQLEGVKISEILSQQVVGERMADMIWHSTIDPDVVDVVVVDPENLSLNDLSKYIDFLRDNQQDSAKYELAFWARLINPFITLVMLLVSAPFVVGVGRGIPLGPRMMVGILIGMGFNIIDNTVGQMGVVYGLNPLLVAVLPSILVLMGAFYAISRLR